MASEKYPRQVTPVKQLNTNYANTQVAQPPIQLHSLYVSTLTYAQISLRVSDP